MEINPDIIKKNPDIVQTIKRVSTSVFFFCIVYSWTMKIWLCLPDGHNQHFFLGRSLKFGAFFCLFCLLPWEMVCKVNEKISWSWLVLFLQNWRKSLWFVKSTYFLSQAIQNQIYICEWLGLITCFVTDQWIADVLADVAVVDAKAHYCLRNLIIGQEQKFLGANWNGPVVGVRNVSQNHR